MHKASPPTVTIAASTRRAAESTELLFSRLEQFANLSDDARAYEDFAQHYPDFLPAIFFDAELGQAPVGWRVEFHQLSLVFRDLLRDVWKHGDNAELAILMGTAEREWEIINRKAEPRTLDAIFRGYETRLKEASAGIPTRYFALTAKVHPDWSVGTFRYEANTEFRKAIYQLFRQSWRARVCPRCSRYFVAGKPAQLYCSSKCYGEIKRDRDLEFWRNVGSNRRKKRIAKERGS